MSKKPIRIGIIGVGNCASSLLQGIEYYRTRQSEDAFGIVFWNIGGYTPGDIIVASAFDVDVRKVGLDVHDAIFSPPNCTKKLDVEMSKSGVNVTMGQILDGIAPHMQEEEEPYTFLPSTSEESSREQIIAILKESETEILLNYLPVGSERASQFYAECALEAGVAFINNIPVFLASDPSWANKFADAGLPIIGDDIKSQLGATIVHRVLVNLFAQRGVKLERTYQMNSGGNTDFLNMKDQSRLQSKRVSKTEAVKSLMSNEPDSRDVHIGPSDYIPWLKDNKVAFIRMEGKLFGNIPMNLEMRLSVEDSPNSAGSAIDTIRLCKMALQQGVSGTLDAPSALYCKHPPQQFTDDVAYEMTKKFIDEGE